MHHQSLQQDAFFWALQGICALHRKPFSVDLAKQQLAAPYTIDALLRAPTAYGFNATPRKTKTDKLHKESFPLVAWLAMKPKEATQDDHGLVVDAEEVTPSEAPAAETVPALILQADTANVLLLEADDTTPRCLPALPPSSSPTPTTPSPMRSNKA